MDSAGNPRPADAPGLTIAFRPVVDVVGGRIFAYEAMLRGPQGESGEEIRDILPADRHAELDRRAAVAAVHHAMAAGLGGTTARLILPVHAPRVGAATGALDAALQAGKRCGLIAERMIFAIHDYQDVPGGRLADLVESQRRAGALTAFFGMGHDPAGFTPCIRYQPAMVRLHAEFVGGIDASWSRRLMLEELTPRLRKLGMRVIADGVDRPGVLQRLRSFGVFHAQGSHVGEVAVGVLPAHTLPPAAIAATAAT